MKCSSNPGNVGHQFFRSRFIDPAPPMQIYEVETASSKKRNQTRIFIPCKVTENKFLMEADEDYISRLEDLPENERKALLEGDWYTFEGQFFPEFSYDIHVTKNLPKIDKNTRIYTTMDYGLDMYALYFVAVNDHKATVFGEIYEPNKIISDAAQLLKAKQKELNIEKVDQYLAPSDLWNRRQETGKSVADIFRGYGVWLSKTSRDRIDGWAATKDWIKVYEDEQKIKVSDLTIHEGCVNLIRCMQAIQYDERRPNDCAVNPHELTHAPDALRGFCVYWSRGNTEPPKPDERFLREEREIEQFNSPELYDAYGNHGSTNSAFDDLWGS